MMQVRLPPAAPTPSIAMNPLATASSVKMSLNATSAQYPRGSPKSRRRNQTQSCNSQIANPPPLAPALSAKQSSTISFPIHHTSTTSIPSSIFTTPPQHTIVSQSPSLNRRSGNRITHNGNKENSRVGGNTTPQHPTRTLSSKSAPASLAPKIYPSTPEKTICSPSAAPAASPNSIQHNRSPHRHKHHSGHRSVTESTQTKPLNISQPPSSTSHHQSSPPSTSINVLYAGADFQNSPPANSLPIPTFATRTPLDFSRS